MAHEFTINKPDNLSETLLRVSKIFKDNGETFQGDEKSGRFSGKGVAGSYVVGERGIKITIIKKPLIAPYSMVEGKIKEYFGNA